LYKFLNILAKRFFSCIERIYVTTQVYDFTLYIEHGSYNIVVKSYILGNN